MFHGHQKNPTLIKFFFDKPVIRDVQSGLTHSVVLLEDGSLYSMGTFYVQIIDSQLYEVMHSRPVQILITKPEFYLFSWWKYNKEQPIQSICVNHYGTVVETKQGEWYKFGNRLVQKDNYNVPHQIQLLSISNVKKMVAIKNNFIYLNQSNEVHELMEPCFNKNDFGKCSLLKTQIRDIQAGYLDLFLFGQFYYSFSHKKWTDVKFEYT